MICAGRPGGVSKRNGAPGALTALENAFAAAKRGATPAFSNHDGAVRARRGRGNKQRNLAEARFLVCKRARKTYYFGIRIKKCVSSSPIKRAPLFSITFCDAILSLFTRRYGVLPMRYVSNASSSIRSHLFAFGTDIPIFFAIVVVGTPSDFKCLSSKTVLWKSLFFTSFSLFLI